MANLTQDMNTAWGMLAPVNTAYKTNQASKISSLNQQLGLANIGYGVDSRYQNQMAGYSGQRLGLQGEELSNQQQALNRQMTDYLPAQENISNRGFDLQGRQLVSGAKGQMRGLTSDATARGAMATEGTRQGFKDIYEQLAYGQEGLGLEKEGSDLSYRQQRDQLKDNQKQLDIAAKSLGIDRSELTTRTEYALNQLGLQNVLTQADIHQAINDVSAGLDNPLISLLPQIYQLTGLRPTASAGGATTPGGSSYKSGVVSNAGPTGQKGNVIPGGMRRY